MKQKKPYEPPKIIDLQVDYAQAVGQSKCLTGGQATGQCTGGSTATGACNTGPAFRAQACQNGNRALNCKTGSSAG